MLSAHGAELVVLRAAPDAVADVSLARCDVLLNIGWRVTAGLMDRLSRCRLVVIYGIGADAVDLAAATERGIVVANTPLANVDDVANHAVTLLLASLRRLLPLDAAVRGGRYDWQVMRPSHNPRGKTLGLVAFGNTARALAGKMTAAFGMQAIAYDPYAPREVAEAHGVRLAPLEEVMRTADLISVHAPLTPETRGMIGAAELGMLKPTSHLVVTGRGGVVDESALVQALREGRIAGAALDVQVDEPLSAEDPLFAAPNLILTPHCAGYSEESFVELKRLACEAACCVLEGRWPRWVVNRGVVPRAPLAGEYLPEAAVSGRRIDAGNCGQPD